MKVSDQTINFVFFQWGWWLCLFSAVLQSSLLLSLTLIVFLGMHFWLIAQNKKAELILILTCGLVGLIVDSALIVVGVFSFPRDGAIQLAPPWLIGMWLLFGSTLIHSMRWALKKKWLAALGGAVFAPLSYRVGENFEILHFHLSSTASMLTLGLLWAILTPLILWLAEKLTSVPAQLSQIETGRTSTLR